MLLPQRYSLQLLQRLSQRQLHDADDAAQMWLHLQLLQRLTQQPGAGRRQRSVALNTAELKAALRLGYSGPLRR